MPNNSMMSDGNGVMVPQTPPTGVPQNMATAGTGVSNPPAPATSQFNDQQLLNMWKRWKKESFDQRWIFERQWMRNVWYILNRQWIYFDSKRGQWQDKRLAKWIPRPVTNILKDGVDAVRANFALINYGANARPLGNDNANVIAAGVADDYAPVLHESHNMDFVMNEFDFWTLVTGNAFLHTAVEKARKNGVIKIRQETCVQCQQTSTEVDIANNHQLCPSCNGNSFIPATNPDGSPMAPLEQELPKGITYALSPFELAFPLMYEKFDDTPYVIRMRWRDKSYYEQHPEFKDTYAKTLSFSKTPQERTMQIFKTLPFQGDIGITPPYFASGGANVDTEGVVEYDIWVKPCADFPDGQVIRIAGDAAPVVIHSELESLPGPLPYHSADGNPIFTFHHARYSHIGGRVIGASLIDPAIQKQDQLNQLDSHMMMTIGRMANPIWLEPKGAEVEKFTGEPGLVVKWNPLVAGGNAKPERIPGEGINASVFQYRGLIKQEAQELMGVYDILRGEQPTGVDAYATMSLLLERAQGRHASAYKERGRAYKGWFKDALEIEREFGEDTQTRAIMAPGRGWAFKEFEKANLSGAFDIIIEDGTLTPKTSLGQRAAIDHLSEMQLLDPTDPDQKVQVYREFGMSRLLPAIDAQVQEAWKNMELFEAFWESDKAQQMAAETETLPLVYRRWYNPRIHHNETVKWALSDAGRKVFQEHPAAMQMLEQYLLTIDIAIQQEAQGVLDANGVPIPMNPQQPPAAPGQPTGQPGQTEPPPQRPEQQGRHGARQAMRNSDRNAAGVGASSSGAGGTASTAAGHAQQLKQGQVPAPGMA